MRDRAQAQPYPYPYPYPCPGQPRAAAVLSSMPCVHRRRVQRPQSLQPWRVGALEMVERRLVRVRVRVECRRIP